MYDYSYIYVKYAICKICISINYTINLPTLNTIRQSILIVYKLNHPITYNYVIIQVEKNNIWINFMNYKKIYFQIIRNRRNNPLPEEEYGEVHHIIPRSFSGLDTPENLICLSAREHFIVHFLLYKIYKYRITKIFVKSEREKERYKKMTFAFSMMVNAKSKSYTKLDKNINNRLYEELRKSVCEVRTIYSYEYIKTLFDFYIKNNISPKTMGILNKQFNTSFAHATLKRLFYKYNLKITDYRDSSVLKKYNYDKNKIQEMFDFYIKNNITQKTMGVLNKQFNTSFAHAALKSLFYKYNLKISDYRDCPSLIKYSYDKNKIQEMFDFYIKNNITQKTMKIFNEQFNTSFTIGKLRQLFYRNNLKISNYRVAVV